jgi:hypothetical protein
MKLEHLRWPFFNERHRKLAVEFSEWAARELAVHERDEGNDGRVGERYSRFSAKTAGSKKRCL